MKTLAEAVAAFLEASKSEWGSPGAQKAMKRLQQLAPSAARADVDAAAGLVAGSLGEWPAPEVGQLALMLGMFVEMGADARAHVGALLERGRPLVVGAQAFVHAVEQVLPEREDEGSDDDDEGDGLDDDDDDELEEDDEDDDDVDDDDVDDDDEHEHGEHEHGEHCDHEHDDAVQAAYVGVAARMPEEASAAQAFPPAALAMIALLSRSPEGRALARRDAALLDAARRLANAAQPPPNAKFLASMLHVLDGERLVVLHPASGRGFEVTLSGVADNFQLHTLLGAELVPRGLPGTAPAPAVAACARGKGPQEAGTTASGVFNLHHWTAVRADGSVAHDQSDHWIWNEGVPADILPFDGRRVVVLGPPPYARTWGAARLFDAMPASVTVERELAPDEVLAWLTRLGQAPRPTGPRVMHGGP